MVNDSEQKILDQFFMYPMKKFQLRELSRLTDVSPPSLKNYLEDLMEKGLVEKVDEGVYPGYKAIQNKDFKRKKKLRTVEKLYDSGFVEFLKDELSPEAVVLFGSAVEGEDIEKSDIDILSVSGSKELDLKEFEEEFNREINIQFIDREDLKKDKEFANNIANGIVLEGYLVVK